MNKLTIVSGSLADAAAKGGASLAESFVDAEAIILLDCSGSMASHDNQDGGSRHQVACEELAHLQKAHPGKLALIQFSDIALFVPGGKPSKPYGSTNLAGALRFAKIADVPGMTFFVVSDGQPDNERAALTVAATIKATISAIYIGPEGGRGQRFLERLAHANGGQFATDHGAMQLAATTERLLLKS